MQTVSDRAGNWLAASSDGVFIGNGALLQEIFGGVGAVSHKAEYSLAPVAFWGQLWTNLLQGGQHSVDYHRWILVLAVCLVIVTGIRLGISAGDKKSVTGLEKALFLSCGSILLFAFAAGCLGQQHRGGYPLGAWSVEGLPGEPGCCG